MICFVLNCMVVGDLAIFWCSNMERKLNRYKLSVMHRVHWLIQWNQRTCLRICLLMEDHSHMLIYWPGNFHLMHSLQLALGALSLCLSLSWYKIICQSISSHFKVFLCIRLIFLRSWSLLPSRYLFLRATTKSYLSKLSIEKYTILVSAFRLINMMASFYIFLLTSSNGCILGYMHMHL